MFNSDQDIHLSFQNKIFERMDIYFMMRISLVPDLVLTGW